MMDLLKYKKPLIISGPCSIESKEQLFTTAEKLVKAGKTDILRGGVWKPRTHPGSFEGLGETALEWLAELKDIFNIPIATEVASSAHVHLAMKYGVDIIWIGARTTVSPFAVQDIADALVSYPNTKVLVKNPINPDIELWTGAVQRILKSGILKENVGLIHRGFSHYGPHKYRNVPIWPIALEMKRRFPDMAILLDPSHITGNSNYVAEVSQIAANLHYDGLIIESHYSPKTALSDNNQQVTPDELNKILDSIIWRKESVTDPAYVQKIIQYRNVIDEIDISILELLAKRMDISEKIGEIKKKNNVAILQQSRWSDIVSNAVERAVTLGLSEEFITKLLDSIHMESIRHQNTIMDN